jgi:hypothetical protein
MKFLLTNTIIFFFSVYVFSQAKIIDKSNFLIEDLKHTGRVKSIILKDYNFQALSNKNDTLIVLRMYEFSKNNKLTAQFFFDKSIKNLYQRVAFYDNGEIRKISRNNNGTMITLIEQFFENENNYPYLIKKYNDFGIMNELYLSTFKKKLLVKREHFINDSLSEWNIYQYDKKNRLIEEKYFSSDNPTGALMKENEKYSLTFYPEHLIEYAYNQNSDTIIETKNRTSVNRKEIKKTVKKKLYTYEITNKFDTQKLKERVEIYKSKDSISEKRTHFDENGKLRSENLSITTPLLLTSITKNKDFYSDSDRKISTEIHYEFDDKKNWIKKTYKQNGVIVKTTQREIKYYD